MTKLTIKDLPKPALVMIIKGLVKKPDQLLTEKHIAEIIVRDRWRRIMQATARAGQKEMAARKTRGVSAKRKLERAIHRDQLAAVTLYESTKKMASAHELTEWVERMAV